MALYNNQLKYNNQYSSFFNSAPRQVQVMEKGFTMEATALDCITLLAEVAYIPEIIDLSTSLSVTESVACTDLILPVIADMVLFDVGLGMDSTLDLTGNLFLNEIGAGMEKAGVNSYHLMNDSASGMNFIPSLDADSIISGHGLGVDSIPEHAVNLILHEEGVETDNTGMNAYFILSENRSVTDSITILANITACEMGKPSDLLLPSDIIYNIHEAAYGEDKPQAAKTFFLVDSSNILHPLGVVVLRGRDDFLPGSKNYLEEIPGRHGSINLGRAFKPRVFELRVADNMDPTDGEKLKRAVARWLNPLAGPKPLVFAEDLEKTYMVKYAGSINLERWPNWMEFTIPLKACDPYVLGSIEQNYAGNGTISNEGNAETSLSIEIKGPVINPSVMVGDSVLKWAGTVPSGQTLLIDTGEMKVTLNGQNALGKYSGGFPRLQPGQTNVSADGNTVFRWRSRWSGC